MQENDRNDMIIKLLISPRLRIIRHMCLFAFTLSVSAGFVWHMVEDGYPMNSFEQYGGLLFFVFLFSGGSLLNIYVLTPRLLLKNKWGIFFCSLLCIVLLIMASIILIQSVYFEHTDHSSEETNLPNAVVTFLSSTLSIFLLFAGTSTLVLFKQWILDMQQAEELESTTLQTELKLLENQINPHFLFNMLNNANIMIRKDPDTALHIIDRLEDMLRYQMNDNSREKVHLKDELLFLNDFLELEKTRRDDFDYTITIDGDTDNISVYPLLFIAFVENAVKHNTDSRAASYVHIRFNVIKSILIFSCENSIPTRPLVNRSGGIGLVNIKRRLDLLYNNKYRLEQTKTETKYIVKLELNI